MQRMVNVIIEKVLFGLTGLVWVAGLLAAGSDSPFMPWPNLLGLILFAGSSFLMGKKIKKSENAKPARGNSPGSLFASACGERVQYMARPRSSRLNHVMSISLKG